MIRQREFITLLGCAAAAWPLAARAQQAGKAYRIGFLGVTSYAEYRYLVDALRMGLRQLGYEEGKNIVIEYRWAEGKFDRLPALATELVNLNIEVLVTHSTAGALAAKQATSTIPVVMAAGADPVATGLVAGLHRPGGNLTGSMQFWTKVAAKRVELIKEVIPALTNVAVLVQSGAPATHITLTAMERVADTLGLELIPVELKARDDIVASIAAVAAQRARALVLMEGPLWISNVRQIADLALESRLPMISFKTETKAGALLEYGANVADLFYRSAMFIDKILKGTPPADRPIERAVKFDLVVNLNSAKTLGIEVPTSLLIRADEVIE